MRIVNGGQPPSDTVPKPDLRELLRYYGVYAEHDGMYHCVVHTEGNPSMSVDLDKQLVNCFSCGFGGDAIAIIERKEGLEFKEALEWAKSQDFSPSGAEPEPVAFGRRRPKNEKRNGHGWKRPW